MSVRIACQRVRSTAARSLAVRGGRSPRRPGAPGRAPPRKPSVCRWCVAGSSGRNRTSLPARCWCPAGRRRHGNGTGRAGSCGLLSRSGRRRLPSRRRTRGVGTGRHTGHRATVGAGSASVLFKMCAARCTQPKALLMSGHSGAVSCRAQPIRRLKSWIGLVAPLFCRHAGGCLPRPPAGPSASARRRRAALGRHRSRRCAPPRSSPGPDRLQRPSTARSIGRIPRIRFFSSFLAWASKIGCAASRR
jgi:hypothetical protein